MYASVFYIFNGFRRLCSVCQMNSQVKYSLRGLCQESKHDRVFFFEKSDENGSMPYFKGISSSILTYNQSNWILTHLRYKSHGYLANDSILPIGRHSWVLDDCGLNKSVSLTLTKCDTTGFTCNDGSCIHISARCDLKPDCPDQSDEFNCQRVVMDGKYIIIHLLTIREVG